MSTKSMLTGMTGFLVGGLAGALVALFSAPHSGAETRAMLRDKSVELKDKALERVEQTRSQATQFVDHVKENVQTRTNKLMDVGREFISKEKPLIEDTTQKAQKAARA